MSSSTGLISPRPSRVSATSWTRLTAEARLPPKSMSVPSPLDLGSPVDESTAEPCFTFDHFFLSSSASSHTNALSHHPNSAWEGWSWIPPADAFSLGQTPPPVTPANVMYTSRKMPSETPRARVRSSARERIEMYNCVHASARKRGSKHLTQHSHSTDHSYQSAGIESLDNLIAQHNQSLAKLLVSNSCGDC
jgi:hypothetical protein